MAFTEEKMAVLDAVQQDGDALRYASYEMKADKDVVLAAIKQNGTSFRHAADHLKNDKDFVQVGVQTTRYALQNASEELKADHAICMTAVQSDPWAIEYCHDDLHYDLDIVREVGRDDVAFIAICQSSKDPIYQYVAALGRDVADEHWPTVKDYLMDEANQDLLSTFDRPDDIHAMVQSQLMGDIQEVELPYLDMDQAPVAPVSAIEQEKRELLAKINEQEDNVDLIEHASDAVRNDREFALQVVSIYGDGLHAFTEAVRNDYEVVVTAVRQYRSSVDFAGPELANDARLQYLAKYNKTISDEQWPEVKASLDANKDLLEDMPLAGVKAHVESVLTKEVVIEAFELPADLLAECSSENTDYETALTKAQEASQAQKAQDRDR